MAGAEWRVAAVAVVVVDPAEFVLFCARRDARPKLPYHMTHVSVVRPSLFEYPPPQLLESGKAASPSE